MATAPPVQHDPLNRASVATAAGPCSSPVSGKIAGCVSTVACGTGRLDQSGPLCCSQGGRGEFQEVVDQNAAVMLVVVGSDPFGV